MFASPEPPPVLTAPLTLRFPLIDTLLTVIFGRRITKQYPDKLPTEIEDMHLGNPVMRSYYNNGVVKHYVRDHDVLRFEAATNHVAQDYNIPKAVENLDALREKMPGITHRYQVQQDILETFLDRGELTKLAEPTVLANGKRIPGLQLDHPRQLALMSSLVRFSYVAAGGTFTTAELRAGVAEALGIAEDACALGSLRYELWKLRAKDLIESFHARAVIDSYQTATVSASYFSSCSTRSMRPLNAGLLHPRR